MLPVTRFTGADFYSFLVKNIYIHSMNQSELRANDMQGEKVAKISYQQSNHKNDPQAIWMLPTQLLMEPPKKTGIAVSKISFVSKSGDCHLNRK